jgi:hypothetical protein
MPVLISCAACQQTLRIPEDGLGKSVRCPRCSTVFAAHWPAPSAHDGSGERPSASGPGRDTLSDRASPSVPTPAAPAAAAAPVVRLHVRCERSGATFLLTGTPLARGGEAAVYAVPQQPGLVAKVYHQPTAEHAAKLEAMLANPPTDPMAARGAISVAWPVDRLLHAGDLRLCLGYVMPRVEQVRPVFEFYNPRTRLQACPLFHHGYLLRTARNLAAAVRAVHERGYVIGDLNESNILVNTMALVTLVDTDSFQVRHQGRVFRCPVGKPEYSPPELQQARFGDFDRGPEQDAFGLAVLFFQLLMQGIHPFAGRYTGPGEPAGLAERIAAGHWPYARSRPVPYLANPHAPPFEVLPPAVQELMRRCFEEGHVRSAVRPDAGAWQQALQQAEEEMVTCPVNGQHLYHRGLRACPWCELARRQILDPFPSKEDVQAGKVAVRPAAAQAPLPAAGTLPSPCREGTPPLPPVGRSDDVLELVVLQEAPSVGGRERLRPSRDFPQDEQPASNLLPVFLGLGGVALLLLLGVVVYLLVRSPERPAAPGGEQPVAQAKPQEEKPAAKAELPVQNAPLKEAEPPKVDAPKFELPKQNKPKNEAAPPLPPMGLPALQLPEPKATGVSLAKGTRRVSDLRVTSLAVDGAKVVRYLSWSRDGKAFFVLESSGVLRRVALDGFVEQARLDIGRVCGALTDSAEGLLVAVTDLQEAWIIDPVRLRVTGRVPAPSVQWLASSPALSVAFTVGGSGFQNQVSALDLKRRQVVPLPRGDFRGLLGFDRPVASPDGKYLFTMGGIEQLHRFRIDGTSLVHEESSPRIAQGHVEGICVSPDSKFVCLPSGGGNYQGMPNHPPAAAYSTYVYPVTNLNRPAVSLRSGAYPNAVGFDPRTGNLYTHNHAKQLMVFTAGGVLQKEYALEQNGLRLHQFLVHPAGERLLVLTSSQLLFVSLREP